MHRLIAGILSAALALAPASAGQMSLLGAGAPVAAAGYVGPLDVAGYTGAAAYWGLRCSKSSYTGNVAEIWDAATGVTTRTLLTCSSGGILNETVNTLATTCASGCVVGTIYDQTAGSFGNLNTSVSATLRPSLVRSGVGFGSVPVVHCDSTIGAITTSANSPAFTQPFTISQVMRTTAAFSATSDSFSSANAVQVQSSSANTWLYFAGTVQNFTLNDTLWGASAFVFNGASSTSNVSNSTNNPSATPSSAVNAGSNSFDTANTVGICARTSGGLNFEGYVFETILVSGSVSGANQAALISNQRAYGGGF